MHHSSVTLRQSLVLVIIQVVVLELLISALTFVLKVPIISGMISSMMLYATITVFMQIMNVAFIILIMLRWANLEYVLDNGSLIIRRGVLHKREKTYALDNVETVEIEQDVLGRILGYGSIHVYSPLFQEHVYVHGITNPQKFASEIKQYVPTGTRITVAPKR